MGTGETLEATVPKWAADLGVGMAKIEARTEEIPKIIQELKELRANSVPMQEHVRLLQDVKTLQERDLGARSDWDEMLVRVPTMWDERAQLRGTVRALRWIVAGLGGAIALLTLWTVLYNTGVSVVVK